MRRQNGKEACNGQASSSTGFQVPELEADIDNNFVDTRVTCPNMEALKKQRKARTRKAMEVSYPWTCYPVFT